MTQLSVVFGPQYNHDYCSLVRGTGESFVMVKYVIPSLLDPVREYVKPNNPNHEELEADYIAWIDSAAFLTENHKKAWKKAELPLLMSRVFPEADKHQLQVALEYMMLFLILEQLTDAPASTAEAKQWADVFLQAIRQTLGETKGPASVMKHLASRIFAAVKPIYHPYFIASNVQLAEGVVMEATGRENPDRVTTLEQYMTERRYSIGFRAFLDLGRWMWAVDLPDHVLSHPLVAKLEQDVTDMVSLTNDLYSYRKEFYESAAHHNYVTVAMHDPISLVPAGDVQAAIDYTVKQFINLLAHFNRTKDALPSFGDAIDHKISLYIALMMDGIVGNTQWSLACRRYGHSPDAEGTVEFEMTQM